MYLSSRADTPRPEESRRKLWKTNKEKSRKTLARATTILGRPSFAAPYVRPAYIWQEAKNRSGCNALEPTGWHKSLYYVIVVLGFRRFSDFAGRFFSVLFAHVLAAFYSVLFPLFVISIFIEKSLTLFKELQRFPKFMTLIEFMNFLQFCEIFLIYKYF